VKQKINKIAIHGNFYLYFSFKTPTTTSSASSLNLKGRRGLVSQQNNIVKTFSIQFRFSETTLKQLHKITYKYIPTWYLKK
jgi:hypothetical protein